MTGQSIGKFITDNHDFLTQCLIFTTLVAKMARDAYVGRKRDKKDAKEKEEAKVEREEIIKKVDTNTALTAHVANAFAQSQGKSLEDIIVEADRDFDEMLSRYLYRESNVNEQRRTGRREL